MKNVLRVLLCVLVLGLLTVGVLGKEVPTPAGDVVLTVSGVIALTNDGDTFKLDMDMLKALPYLAYEVDDPWMGTQTYGGVELRTLLDYVGIPAGASRVVMVCSDEAEFAVSQGGPIKLVYPYNSYPEIQDLYDENQWAWYVVEIRVEY